MGIGLPFVKYVVARNGNSDPTRGSNLKNSAKINALIERLQNDEKLDAKGRFFSSEYYQQGEPWLKDGVFETNLADMPQLARLLKSYSYCTIVMPSESDWKLLTRQNPSFTTLLGNTRHPIIFADKALTIIRRFEKGFIPDPTDAIIMQSLRWFYRQTKMQEKLVPSKHSSLVA